MIKLENLTFTYPSGTPLFQNFHWRVQRGERWAILGPSGCGKTTLLYLLAGLRFPVSGDLRIKGEKLTRPRPQSGLILQEYGLLPWATVQENIQLGLRIRDFYGADGIHAPRGGTSATSNLAAWTEYLGLEGLLDSYPAQLSGGQRQRTAIARTLALSPDLLLMDEPFSSLDAPTRADLQSIIIKLCHQQNLTLVLVTHSIEEAALMGQKILLLRQPPNSTTLVIENLQSGQPNYIQSEAYAAQCQNLRARMTNP